MSNVPKAKRQARKLPYFEQVKKFINEFPDLRYDGAKVMCTVCQRDLMCVKKMHCERHVNTPGHINRKKLKEKGLPRKTDFVFDLLCMLICCNLPFTLVDAPAFRNFWHKYNSDYELPTKRTVCRYLPSARQTVESNIKSELKNQRLWLCIDETTDCKKRSILNIIVRVLNPSKSTLPLLLASKRLQECTSEKITEVIVNVLKHFELSTSQVLMVMTDGASTMLAVGRSLKELKWNFLHITCKVHAFHLVAECIRNCFPKVDELIANSKQVFLKSPKRIREFHKKCPGIPEPPQPVIVRWGTWLKAAFYYSEHFQEVKNVILQFNPKDAAAIKRSQSTFQDISVETDVHTIHNKYTGLYDAIEMLQNSALSLKQSLQIVDDVNNLLQAVTDAKTAPVLDKFQNVLMKNSDFTALKQIYNGASTHPLSQFKDYFNYACITSVDVERSFSHYKLIVSPRRTSILETTVETLMMVSMFNKYHSVCTASDSDGGSTSYSS